MSSTINTTYPGSKRGPEEEHHLVRRRLDSQGSSIKPLPQEIWGLVASYLKADDLKSLSKVSRICKAAALSVQNTLELKTTSKNLESLSTLDATFVKEVLSIEDVYKNFIHFRANTGITPGLNIDPIEFEKLQQTLTALAKQASTQALDLSQMCFKEIDEGMLCFNCIKDLYLSKKQELFLQAYNHIIASCQDPVVARGVAVKEASKFGYFDLALALSKNGEIHEYHRGLAVIKSIEHGNIAFLKSLLKTGKIDDLNRSIATLDSMKIGRLNFINVLVSSGPILESYQKKAIQKAKDQGYDEITSLLERAVIAEELPIG